MKRFKWPRHSADCVAMPSRDHSSIRLSLRQLLDQARAGRAAFQAKRFYDAKYHRECCALLLWRVSVDGVLASGQLRIDGAKWETRIPGRLSSEAARAIRLSPELRRRKQSSLENKLVSDHIVPRNCLAEALIRPDWVDLDDTDGAFEFILVHAEVAIISPAQNAHLKNLDLNEKMPAAWWDASFSDKEKHRFARYERAGIKVTPWEPEIEQPHQDGVLKHDTAPKGGHRDAPEAQD